MPPSSPFIRPTLTSIVRLVRAARDSPPPNKVGQEWAIGNLVLSDLSHALELIDIAPLTAVVKLDVVAIPKGGTWDPSASPQSRIIAERWRIAVGSSNDDAETVAANAVLVHALYAYLRIGELYAERSKGTSFKVVLSASVADPPSDGSWEKRFWTIPDGLSVHVAHNRLWRREWQEASLLVQNASLTSVGLPSPLGGLVGILKDQRESSPQPGPNAESSPSASISGSAARDEQSTAAKPTTTFPPPVPPLQLGTRGTTPLSSPNLGPSVPPSEVLPIGSLGVARGSSYPTPPFQPASLPLGSLGSNFGLSPTPAPLLASELLPPVATQSIPTASFTATFNGAGSIHYSNYAFSTSQFGSNPTGNRVPGLAPLIPEEDAASPTSRGPPADGFDTFAPLHSAEDVTEEESEKVADCSTFMIACEECNLQKRKIHVYDFVASVKDL